MATVVFFGNERLATGVDTSVPTLKAIIEAGHDVKAVVSNYERGTSRNARKLEIQELAEAHSIPVLLPHKPSEIAEQLVTYKAEVAVLVAYGKIVPQSVIDIFPKGIINIHPSLLPLHRGPTPLESVILNGETVTGVSVMSLAKEMDAGPVYKQSTITLSGEETKQELADTLLALGSEMVIGLLPGIIDGSVTASPQDDSQATYDSLINKEAGIIDWTKPAEILNREIRAFSGWPQSRTTFAGKDIIITETHVSPSQSPGSKPGDIDIIEEIKEFGVVTGSGTLWIDELKPAGKKEMPAKAFLAGYGHLLKS